MRSTGLQHALAQAEGTRPPLSRAWASKYASSAPQSAGTSPLAAGGIASRPAGPSSDSRTSASSISSGSIPLPSHAPTRKAARTVPAASRMEGENGRSASETQKSLIQFSILSWVYGPIMLLLASFWELENSSRPRPHPKRSPNTLMVSDGPGCLGGGEWSCRRRMALWVWRPANGWRLWRSGRRFHYYRVSCDPRTILKRRCNWPRMAKKLFARAGAAMAITRSSTLAAVK